MNRIKELRKILSQVTSDIKRIETKQNKGE